MKDIAERLAECVRIRSQLRDLAIDELCEDLHRAMNDFVKYARSSTGSFMMMGRTLQYTLSTKHETFVKLVQ